MVDLTSLNGLSEQLTSFMETNPWLLYIVIALLVWKLIWYGLALFKSIEKKQKAWFVVLFVAAFVLNDLGVLPIIYLIIHRDKDLKKSRKKKK